MEVCKKRKDFVKKNKTYPEEAIQKAIHEIRNGMSVYKASKLYHIPRTTLRDKIKNKYLQETPGAPTILTLQEETKLVQWIKYLADAGFPVTKNQLAQSVADLLKELKRPNSFKNGIPGRRWYERFLQRHKSLSERVAQNLTKSRSAVTEDNIKNWFQTVHKYFVEQNCLDVLEDPTRVFNCDESAFFFSPQSKTVITKRGQKKVYKIATEDKERLTVLMTVAADGEICPPLVLYPYTRVPSNIIAKMPNKWGLGRSESGWMTSESFFEFITNVFYVWLQEKKIKMPVVLFLDGHASHFSLPLTEFCKNKGIILTALHPNATHILQPLDVAIFKPLKQSWKEARDTWALENQNEKLKKEDFAPLLKTCIDKSCKKSTIINGFRTCGLYPFDEDNVNYDLIVKKDININVYENEADKTEKCSCQNDLQFLKEFEERINEETLKEFRNSTEEKVLNSPFFKFWKNIKRCHHFNLNQNTLDINNLEIIIDNNIEDFDVSLNNLSIHESIWEMNDNVINLEVQENGEATIVGELIGAESSPRKIIAEENACKNTFPTPFKNALYWPEKTIEQSSSKKKRLTPTVAISDEYMEFQRRRAEDQQEKSAKKRKRKTPMQKEKLDKENCGENSKTQNADRTKNDSFAALKKPKVGEYVIFTYEEEFFPGIVMKITSEGFTIKAMTMCGAYWKWPDQDDILVYSQVDVLSVIPNPELMNNRGQYKIPEIEIYRSKKLN